MTEKETTIVICLEASKGNPGHFEDNVYGPCSLCGVRVQWRPHAPEGERWCMGCYARGGGGPVSVTPETRDDIERLRNAERWRPTSWLDGKQSS